MSDVLRIWRVYGEFETEPVYVSAERYNDALASADDTLPTKAAGAVIVYEDE